jgi:hypothetical protein
VGMMKHSYCNKQVLVTNNQIDHRKIFDSNINTAHGKHYNKNFELDSAEFIFGFDVMASLDNYQTLYFPFPIF